MLMHESFLFPYIQNSKDFVVETASTQYVTYTVDWKKELQNDSPVIIITVLMVCNLYELLRQCSRFS